MANARNIRAGAAYIELFVNDSKLVRGLQSASKKLKAFGEAITATSTKWAPWYVVPSDHKWIARATVSAVILHRLKSLGLKAPEVPENQLKELAAARRKLTSER